VARTLRRRDGVTPRRALFRLARSAALALLTACASAPGYDSGYGNVTVDGSDTGSHGRLPPIGYWCYPHYRVRDGYVYDVYGHYYKEHNGDWSAMRGAPSAVRSAIRYEPPVIGDTRACLGEPPDGRPYPPQ
jgi:hypothetical protein